MTLSIESEALCFIEVTVWTITEHAGDVKGPSSHGTFAHSRRSTNMVGKSRIVKCDSAYARTSEVG